MPFRIQPAPTIAHPWRLHSNPAASVAMTAAMQANAGLAKPSMPILVSVARIPAAGVKPPYIQDWKAAAIEPKAKDGKYKTAMTA